VWLTILSMGARCWLIFNLLSLIILMSFLERLLFQPVCSYLVLMPEVILPQVQNFELFLFELHKISVGLVFKFTMIILV